MGLRQRDSEGRGGYARLWSVENKGKYSVAKISTSKKRPDGDGYETDFQDGFVRLVGSAHEKAQTLDITEKGITIQVVSFEVTTPYNHETKKGYTNYAIFAFDVPDSNSNSTTNKKSAAKTSKANTRKAAEEETPQDDDLPF